MSRKDVSPGVVAAGEWRQLLKQSGEHFVPATWTAQLMDDPGRVIVDVSSALPLGGGNPATTPELVVLFQRRLCMPNAAT